MDLLQWMEFNFIMKTFFSLDILPVLTNMLVDFDVRGQK